MPKPHRDLVPKTVYLPPDVVAEVERRAVEKAVSFGTMLRQIVMAAEPPVRR